jgi:hypothetical protein
VEAAAAAAAAGAAAAAAAAAAAGQQQQASSRRVSLGAGEAAGVCAHTGRCTARGWLTGSWLNQESEWLVRGVRMKSACGLVYSRFPRWHYGYVSEQEAIVMCALWFRTMLPPPPHFLSGHDYRPLTACPIGLGRY